MIRIKLENTRSKYYKQDEKLVTEIINGEKVTGTIRTEHPNFNISLVRNGHYYGQIDYYLEVKD